MRNPFGQKLPVDLAVTLTQGKLSSIDFVDMPAGDNVRVDYEMPSVVQQLQAYFDDAHWRFDVPLVLQGTQFQRRVWQALCDIPAGEVRTYGQLARTLGSSARAVGNACRANPIPIVVPCHRVVSAAGLGGYCGATDGIQAQIKRWLLAHEQAVL